MDVVSYPQVILFLCQNNISHIVTFSGILANRGYSFVSSDHKFHLTHEYLLCSDSTTCNGEYQSLRILGVYADNIPLTLITTQQVIDNVEKSRQILNKWILKSQEKNDMHEIEGVFDGLEIVPKFETVKEAIKNAPILKKDLPHINVGRHCTLRKIPKQQQNRENIDQSFLMKRCIDLWWKKQTMSGKILSFVLEHPVGIKNEDLVLFLKNVCHSKDPKQFLVHLTRQDKDYHHVYVQENHLIKIKREAMTYIETKR